MIDQNLVKENKCMKKQPNWVGTVIFKACG